MDDRAKLAQAGSMIHGEWDPQRIERTLRSAKQRRVRRIATRSALGAACVALALFVWRADEPRPAQVAKQVHAPESTPQPSVTPEVSTPQVATQTPPVQATEEQAQVPVDAPVDAQEPAELRSRRSRVQLATTSSKQRADWRVRMHKGDARGAYALLKAEKPALSTLDDLMLAADAARRAGDPRVAANYLEQALRDHAGPRSAVVAFTLGRILRDELHKPAAAAQAFMKVQTSQDAPLMADALAREVEAWQAAGSHERAKERAKLYVQRYPSGERRAWMDRLLQTP